MDIARDFVLRPIPPILDLPFLLDPLGPLRDLPGTWTGSGFNVIWRPLNRLSANAGAHFLELDPTAETLQFDAITGPIPNRGFGQPDINMFGLTYLQQIRNSNLNAGLHVEPGIWATVPATTSPVEPASVVRMASIPHGATLLAQGVATSITGAPVIPDTDITPFVIGNPGALESFQESNLSVPTLARSTALAGVTQAMVDNPNSVLQAAIAGQTIIETIVLTVSTTPAAPVVGGGGTANTAFLQGDPGHGSQNAQVVEVDATFWIETVQGAAGSPDFHQLQYTQRVLLNFGGLSWPHVSVGTLQRVIPLTMDPAIINPRFPAA
jgi:hypothetical protein